MLYRFAPIIAALLCACASWAPGSETRPVPLVELMGLTQSEMRTRLGASRGDDALHFTRLWLEEGVVVAAGDAHIFGYPNPCSRGALANIAYLSAPARVDSFVFRDGRLAQVRGLDGVLTPNDKLQMVCSSRAPRPTESEILTAPILLPMVLAIGVPAHLLTEALESGEAEARDRALAQLRIGAPLPGGVEAYVAAHPRIVHLLRLDGDNADLAVTLFDRGRQAVDRARATNLLYVDIRDGVVSGFVAWPNHFCRLTPDQIVACLPN